MTPWGSILAVRLSPMFGILAIGIHTSSELTRLFPIRTENVQSKPIGALVGAGMIKVIRFAVIPRIPSFHPRFFRF
jgi:ABC-type phosphate/phosphonate transport system permease subunit